LESRQALFSTAPSSPGTYSIPSTLFLSSLRELARKCKFPAAQFDERVRDQFAAGCTNDRIRERLLQKPADRMLENLELVALTLERAQQESPVLAAATSTVGNSSAGSLKGKSSSSSKNGRSRQRSYSRPSRPANYVDKAHSVADGIQSVTIGTVQTSEPGTFKTVNCHLNGVSLLLDLGTKVSILNNKVYFNAIASHPPLQPQTIALRTNSGSRIPYLDCVTLNVKLNGAVNHDFRFYVTEHGMSIMGEDLFHAFGGSVLLGGDRLVSSSLLATMPRKVCLHHCGRLREISCVTGTVSGSSEEIGLADWLRTSTDDRRVG